MMHVVKKKLILKSHLKTTLEPCYQLINGDEWRTSFKGQWQGLAMFISAS